MAIFLEKMMATIVPDEPRLDLTDCDREPIHVPGAIQPHGLLLIASAAGHHPVLAGAGDIEGRLAPDWLGVPLADLLGQDVAPIVATLSGGPHAVAPRPVAGLHGSFSALVHRAGEQLMIELEPMPDEPRTAAATLTWLDAIATGFERATDVQSLCERAAVAFRTLTGFDRVMIYHFLDDDAGRVLAEDKVADLGSFLHHHFPASDIPHQARALYIRNRTRVIPTVDYQPAPLRPSGFAGVDLSDVALRSVSPIHLEYLRNMGVQASASISIVKDGLLWGLVACHHRSPRELAPDLRGAAAILASGLARQIRAKEEAQAYRERLRLRTAEDQVVPRLNNEDPLSRAVHAVKNELKAMMNADGFALVERHAVASIGHCPPAAFITELAGWIRMRGGDPVATHELGALYPAAAGVARASGIIALPLLDEEAMLIWFRAEQVEEIEWAGNPHKAVTAVPGQPLTPRTSFNSWIDTVRGRSRRWTLEEVEAVHRLRRRFHEARQHQEVRRLNRDLNRTLADKDSLLAQKDVLMKEVNHRVQNSLQLVASFLRLQAKTAGSPVAEHLAEAQARLAAVALVHRRLYRDDQVESVDLSRYLDELVADMKTSLGAEWGSRMRLDLAPILVPTDRAVNIGLILTELVINASKYAYGGAPGPISIALEQHRNRLRLIVADDGGGKADSGSGGGGFGSRMMEAMVQRLDGTIAFGDNQPGLRVIMTAPIGEA